MNFNKDYIRLFLHMLPTKEQIMLLEQSSYDYIKVINTLRQLDDKEQRWMQDQDHKVSRVIVDFATDTTISVIRLEQLTNIR